MSDLVLTAMIPPQYDVTYETRDGTPYRCAAETVTIDVLPQHVAELTAQGFTTATASQMLPGDDTSQDIGWSVAQ